MSYKNLAIPEFNDPFFQQRHMQEGWNKNMAAHFDPSWVSVLDESIQEWINQYTFPGWMFVSRKPRLFGNDCHKNVCAKSKVIYNVEIVEGKDRTMMIGKNYFYEKGETAGFMVRMKNPLWVTGKVVVMYSGFCVLGGSISMVEKGFWGSSLIKKRCYWTMGVPEEEILRHMQNKEVGGVDAFQGSIRGKSYHIMAIKEPDYVMLMMTTYGTLEHL